MRKMRLMLAAALVFAVVPFQGAWAQNKDGATRSPLFWDVDQIIDLYVKNMTRYYNLTEAQEVYTQKLLTSRVKRFLKDYEKDVRSLAWEMMDYQFNRELPPAEIAQEWARRGGPLWDVIKEEIIDGNMTWRRILNDEQKSKHDRDLELMRKQFKDFDERLDRWEKGDVRPSDFGKGRVSKEPPSIRRNEDAWMYYVRTFIRLYDLDESQSQSAYSILREMRQLASDYRQRHETEFTQIENRLAELYRTDPDPDPDALAAYQSEIRELNKRRAELVKPISKDMFEQLKKKLELIPTAAQRNVREAVRDKLHRRLEQARESSTTQPTTTTAPAETADNK